MPLFPAYIELSDKEVLVVGGGKVATRKVDKLLSFTKRITVVAPKLSSDMESLVRKHGLKLKRRKFLTGDLREKDVVIVAVDDVRLQERIFNMCEKKRILCNCVDSPRYCNFIFPSLVVAGDLVIGISTSGKLPALSKRLREIIENVLPEDIENILERLSEERKGMEKGKERQKRVVEKVNKLIPLDKR